jgi:hypothetical protein
MVIIVPLDRSVLLDTLFQGALEDREHGVKEPVHMVDERLLVDHPQELLDVPLTVIAGFSGTDLGRLREVVNFPYLEPIGFLNAY